MNSHTTFSLVIEWSSLEGAEKETGQDDLWVLL